MDTDRAKSGLSGEDQEQYKGKAIEDIRLRLGLSQDEFAEILGITQPLLSRVERGERKLSVETATVIAELLAGIVNARENSDRAEIPFVPSTESGRAMGPSVRAEVADPIDAYEVATAVSADASAAVEGFDETESAREVVPGRESLDPETRSGLIAAIAAFCAGLGDADLKSLYELISRRSEVAEADMNNAPSEIPE